MTLQFGFSVLLIGATLVCSLHGQTPAPLSFEAASVKLAPPPDPSRGIRVRISGGPGTADPGRLTVENFSLSNLITAAYDIRNYQLVAPNLSGFERFNISATIPDGTTK